MLECAAHLIIAHRLQCLLGWVNGLVGEAPDLSRLAWPMHAGGHDAHER